MEEHYQSLPISTKQYYTGTRWAPKVIINLWTHVLKLWKKRNELIYEHDNRSMMHAIRDKLEARVHRCYILKDELVFSDRHLWFDKVIQDKMNEEPRHLETWLTMVKRLLRITKREKQKRPRGSQILERFLGLQNNTATLHREHSTMNPRAFQQELNPD
jgi:hypothetical protein